VVRQHSGLIGGTMATGRKVYLVVGAAVTVMGGLVASSTLGAFGATGSSSTTSVPCPPGSAPPGAAPIQCNASDQSAAQAQSEQERPVGASTYISETQAISIARNYHSDSTGAAHALKTTYDEASSLMGEASQPLVNPETEVWIATVTIPGGATAWGSPGGTPNDAVDVYTVILDAANGNLIDACDGCNSVTSG
jgi:hypothetical protein